MTIESWNNEDRPLHPLYDYNWQDPDQIPVCLFLLFKALCNAPLIETHTTVTPCKAIALMTSLDGLLLSLFNDNAQKRNQNHHWTISHESHLFTSTGLHIAFAAILHPNSTTEPPENIRESYNHVFQELINHWESAKAHAYPDLALQRDPEFYALFIKKRGASLIQEQLIIHAIASKLFRPNTMIASSSWRLPSTREDTYLWVKKAAIPFIKEKMGLKI